MDAPNLSFNYNEICEENNGTMRSGCSIQGGRSNVKYLVRNTNVDNPNPSPLSPLDFPQIWNDILGYTILNGGEPSIDGKLQRVLPRVHPVFPYWTATAVQDMYGVGKYVKTGPLVGGGLDPSIVKRMMPGFAFYVAYMISVDFAPTPYQILDDKFITVDNFTWTYFNGTPLSYTYANEWFRYTDFDMQAEYNNVTLPVGGMYFWDTGTDARINGSSFNAGIRMYVPDLIMKMRWHAVPFRYYTSPYSYLRRFAGLVNQFAWNPAGFVQSPIPAGQALYLGAQAKPYLPHIPNVLEEQGVIDYEKLCDLELTFLVTNRTCPTTPAPGDIVGFNNNWITSGHNLQPHHSDRKFHYAVTGATAGLIPTPVNERVPYWRSFPVELLFTDPDFNQPTTGGSPLGAATASGAPLWQTLTDIS